MLCFFVSDLHGKIDRYQKLFSFIKTEKPAAVFIGGDLFPHNHNKANEFNFKSDNPNNVIFVVLKDGQTVLPTTAKVLVEKVANPTKTNQTQAYSYSTPTTPSGQTENGIEFFPGYNSGQAYTSTTPADYTLIYNLYVVGVGSVQLTLHFENTMQ